MYQKLSPLVQDVKILGNTEGYREITKVYIADANGNAVAKAAMRFWK